MCACRWTRSGGREVAIFDLRWRFFYGGWLDFCEVERVFLSIYVRHRDVGWYRCRPMKLDMKVSRLVI